jgi:hypothetical protein
MSPRPGFVLEVDRSTPPTLFWHGEGFPSSAARGEPGHLRPRALDALEDPVAPSATPSSTRSATRTAAGLLRPGMRSPSPSTTSRCRCRRCRRPDVRQLVIEQVLDMAAAAGVDDVVLIARWPCTGG